MFNNQAHSNIQWRMQDLRKEVSDDLGAKILEATPIFA
jgi:hypothetical protein